MLDGIALGDRDSNLDSMIKQVIKALSTSLVALLLGLSFTAAQVAPEKLAFTPPKIAHPLPFKIGETLIYEVTFSKLIFSGTIGELKLTVLKPSDSSKSEMIEFKAEAVSKGFFPALFGLKVRNRYNSLVNPTDFGVQTSTKLLEEGKVRREQTSVFNRETGRVVYTDRDLGLKKSEPKVKEKPSPSWVQDLVSTIYFVRTQPLNEGDVIPIPISEGGEVYNIEVVAGKHQEVKTNAGKFKTIQLNAKVFDGRYVKRSGEMLVWITEDASRTPVRARIKTSGATITVDLKRMF
ncbi:MAG: DUF3108 domain-containing protein [Acidobacteriota bacterium]